MNRKQTIRLNEGHLKRVVAEVVKSVVNEQFGVDFEDTLNWVKKKKPDMSPAEQERFAKNIINKRSRSNSVGGVKEKPSSFKNMRAICDYYNFTPESRWIPYPETREEIEDMGGVLDWSMRFPVEYMRKPNWKEFLDDVEKYLTKGTVKIGGERIVEMTTNYSHNEKYIYITAVTELGL